MGDRSRGLGDIAGSLPVSGSKRDMLLIAD